MPGKFFLFLGVFKFSPFVTVLRALTWGVVSMHDSPRIILYCWGKRQLERGIFLPWRREGLSCIKINIDDFFTVSKLFSWGKAVSAAIGHEKNNPKINVFETSKAKKSFGELLRSCISLFKRIIEAITLLYLHCWHSVVQWLMSFSVVCYSSWR